MPAALDADIEDLIGSASVLDRPLTVTQFHGRGSKTRTPLRTSLRSLADKIRTTHAPTKADLPWLKLASFGEARTDKGALRHDDNMVSIYGVEADYDAGLVTVDQAAEMLAAADLAAVVYTTPSHTAERPRWRLLCPTDRALSPDERTALCARVNGAVGGILAPESFVRSQAYFFGVPNGSAAPDVRLIEGRPINQAGDLDAGALDRSGKTYVRRDAASAPAPSPAENDPDAADFLNETKLAELREALWALPSEWVETHDLWVRAGLIAHHHTGGSAEGLALWDEWSRRTTAGNYKAGETAKRWRSFGRRRRGEPATIATLIQAANNVPRAAGELDADIEALIGGGADDDVSETRPARIGRALKFAKDKKGILPTAANVIMGLGAPSFVGVDVRWDEFKHELVRSPPGALEWQRFQDSDFFDIRLRLEHAGFQPLNRLLIRDAVKHHANTSRIDTAMVWLDSLHWDGASRVERFWVDYFGAEDTAYVRACGRYVWTALAGRVRQPGAQADMVPVICGAQGIGKSRGIRAMAPAADFFTSLSFHESELERARKMRGVLIGEMAELQGLKSRGLDEIKAWITRPTEHWTPKWEEMSTVFHRRCIIFATTNETDFLNDPTGERRWLPITAAAVDVAAVQRDQLQLWAEGATLFDVGGVDWADAQRLAPIEHVNFRSADMWEEEVRAWLETAEGFEDSRPRDRPFITMAEVARQALHMPPGTWKRADEMRIGRVLTHLGWKSTLRRVNGTPSRVWVRS